MSSLKLRQALCVLALVAGPVSAMENGPITDKSKPVIKKEATTTPDGPASPTIINGDDIKPGPVRDPPGLNPKIGPSGGGKPKSAGGTAQDKSTIIEKRDQTDKAIINNIRN